ncbi:MAG: hypothetical protein ACLPGW_13445, partial [Roseiarcus sp.]
MHIERRYTKGSQSPYALIAFETTKSEIRNPDGSVVFSLERIERDQRVRRLRTLGVAPLDMHEPYSRYAADMIR